MIFDGHVLLLVAGMSLSVMFASLILFHTRRAYRTWAKLASIFQCIAGLSWGGLGFLLIHWRHFRITRHMYFILLANKHVLGGLCLGFIFSILLARPYQKKDCEEARLGSNQSMQPTAGRSEANL